MIIEIPLPPKELSPNGGHGHWAARARATKAHREVAWWKAFSVLTTNRMARCTTKAIISVEYRCSKGADGYVARDVQNAIIALKAAIDGLVQGGILVGDSKAFLEWGRVELVTTKSDPRWLAKGDGVTITVEYCKK